MSGVQIEPVSRARQDGDTGFGPDETFDAVENLFDAPGGGGHDGKSERGALVEVLVIHFGSRDGEALS